jgi:hypothetical protein
MDTNRPLPCYVTLFTARSLIFILCLFYKGTTFLLRLFFVFRVFLSCCPELSYLLISEETISKRKSSDQEWLRPGFLKGKSLNRGFSLQWELCKNRNSWASPQSY